MINQTITVVNKLGLHARAASKLVQTAQSYGSAITIANLNHTANGKSIMSILMLQAAVGTELELQVDGEDEAEAMTALVDLIANRFGEAE